MQGIYNHIPETNIIYRLYSVAVIPYFQFMLRVMVFPTLNVYYYYYKILLSVSALRRFTSTLRGNFLYVTYTTNC
jgi:hypothetical protein